MIIHILERNGLNDSILKKVEDNSNSRLILGNLQSHMYAKVKGIYTELSFVLDQKFLSKYPSLKCIATPTTSLTHVDTDYCVKQGISIISLKDKQDLISNFTSTPEVAWWHLIELNRNCSKAQDSVSKRVWDRKNYFAHSFSNKNFGVIGFGRIGQRMAKIAEDFNMNVFAYDIDSEVNKLHSSKTMFLNSIEEIFNLCNFISIHVDDRKSNLNLINQKQFENINVNGTILVNTSRGFVLNSIDAVKALKSGSLGGLGIDVLTEEDDYNFYAKWTDNPIVKAKLEGNLNISITPHLGGATLDTLEIAAEAVFEELCELGTVTL
jgi:D-3-phosphoglycerate dehydrogenase